MHRFVPALVGALAAVGLTAGDGKADPYFLGVDLDLYPPPLIAPPPVIPAPRVQYGCRRFWRCDHNVCEWRRGCWGVYGYVEGPYYTPAFAKRQYEAHGWPRAGNVTVAPAPGLLVGPPPGAIAVTPPVVVNTPVTIVKPPPVVADPGPDVYINEPPLVVTPPPIVAAPAPIVAVPGREAVRTTRKRSRQPPVEPRDK